MNIRLWELDNGDLINLTRIEQITEMSDTHHKTYPKGFKIYLMSGEYIRIRYSTEDEAKLKRFKLVERWNACLDMIYDKQWYPEAGTYASGRPPIDTTGTPQRETREDQFTGYKESEH